MSNTTLVLRNGSQGRKTTSVVTSGRARRRQRIRRRTPQGPATRFLRDYANTLNDPWEFPGVPLGYDCFLPTSQAAVYARSSIPVGTDGAFSIVFTPSAANLVSTTSALQAATPVYTNVPAANNGSVINNFSEARVVSGGLRVMALFPATAAAGVLFSGTTVDQSLSSLTLLSIDTLSQLPNSKLGIGSRGALCTTRSYDNAGYEFFNFPLIGYTNTALPFQSMGYICGKGFPAGTVIWYEAVLNLECVAKSSAFSSAIPSDEKAASSAASFFATAGQLFSSVQDYLHPVTVMDGIDLSYQLASGNMQGAARAALRLGTGRNVQSAASNAQRQGRQNTVLIEEMKDEREYDMPDKRSRATSSRGW